MEHDVLYIPVSIVHSTATIRIHIVVTYIAHALEWTHFTITGFLATILLFPCFCIRQHSIQIHTEQFVSQTGTLVSLAQSLNLARYCTIIRQVSSIAPREVIRILNRNSILSLSSLSLQHDYTTGCTRTVDRSRSGILQYRDVFNVFRIQERDIAHRNAIDNIKRFQCTIDRTDTTDFNRSTTIDVTTIISDSQTRHSTLQCFHYVCLRTTFHGLAYVYSRNSTSQVGLFLSTVTYYNHFIQEFIIISQYNTQTSLRFYFLSLKTNE